MFDSSRFLTFIHSPFTPSAVDIQPNTAGTDVVVGDCASNPGYFGVITPTLDQANGFYATDIGAGPVNGGAQAVCDQDPDKCGCIGDEVMRFKVSLD